MDELDGGLGRAEGGLDFLPGDLPGGGLETRYAAGEFFFEGVGFFFEFFHVFALGDGLGVFGGEAALIRLELVVRLGSEAVGEGDALQFVGIIKQKALEEQAVVEAGLSEFGCLEVGLLGEGEDFVLSQGEGLQVVVQFPLGEVVGGFGDEGLGEGGEFLKEEEGLSGTCLPIKKSEII